MGKTDTSKGGIKSLANDLTDGSLDSLACQINQFFKSVSESLDPLETDCPYLNLHVDYVPSEYIILVTEVEKHLLRLNTRKATGPDHIPGWILKDFVAVLGAPICVIASK